MANSLFRWSICLCVIYF